MSKEEYTIKTIFQNHKILAGKLIIIDYGNDLKIIFQNDQFEISEKGEFPFFILQNIREQLEEKEILLLINANRWDVYPSGMQLMNFNAYEIEIGKLATNSVSILDTTELVEKIGSVKKQNDFFNEWLVSLSSPLS